MKYKSQYISIKYNIIKTENNINHEGNRRVLFFFFR